LQRSAISFCNRPPTGTKAGAYVYSREPLIKSAKRLVGGVLNGDMAWGL